MNLLKAVVALVLSFSSLVVAEGHHKETLTFKSQKVSGSIDMLQGKGGNIAVLSGKDGILMVDDDYKAMTESLKKVLDSYGGEKNLAYIVNTHWHGDHTQGNLELGKNGIIVAHENVRKLLSEKQTIPIFNMVSEPYPKHALPSVTYEKILRLYINDETVLLKHFANGHTNGDSVVFFEKANVVHMGDHFFNGFFPFVDLDHGGNVLNMAKNIGLVLSEIKDDTKIIPGHGPLANKEELRAFKVMLEQTSAEVQAMIDKGYSLEKIQKEGLSEKWQSWGSGFLPEPVWMSIVYNSLK